MSKRYARNPGSDQVAKWKAALAAHHKRQRQRRGRRVDASTRYQLGMARISPPAAHDDPMTLPRCTMPGCPVRWRDGNDRPCSDHRNEVLAAAAELGIDLTWMDTAPGEHGDDVSAGHPLPGGSASFLTEPNDAPDRPHTHT